MRIEIINNSSLSNLQMIKRVKNILKSDENEKYIYRDNVARQWFYGDLSMITVVYDEGTDTLKFNNIHRSLPKPKDTNFEKYEMAYKELLLKIEHNNHFLVQPFLGSDVKDYCYKRLLKNGYDVVCVGADTLVISRI